jgi:hypothetical protein
LDSEEVNTRIAADQLRGKSLGIDRTPVLFINKFQVPLTSLNPPGLHAAIDAVLNQKTRSGVAHLQKRKRADLSRPARSNSP